MRLECLRLLMRHTVLLVAAALTAQALEGLQHMALWLTVPLDLGLPPSGPGSAADVAASSSAGAEEDGEVAAGASQGAAAGAGKAGSSSSSSLPAGTQAWDPWEWWHQVRTLCDHDTLLGCVLRLGPQVRCAWRAHGQRLLSWAERLAEFGHIQLLPARLPTFSNTGHRSHMNTWDPRPQLPPPALLARWAGEPVKAVLLPTRAFTTNKKGYPVLPKAHQDFLSTMFTHHVQVGLRRGVGWVSRALAYVELLSADVRPRGAFLSSWRFCDAPTRAAHAQVIVTGECMHDVPQPPAPLPPNPTPAEAAAHPGYVALDPSSGTGFVINNPGAC